MFGDNESVITSSTIPHSTVAVLHLALGIWTMPSAFVATFASIRMVPFDSVQAFLVMLSKLTTFRNMIGFTLSTGILLRRFHQVCLFQKGNLLNLLLLLMQI